jgi:hypothetical protein
MRKPTVLLVTATLLWAALVYAVAFAAVRFSPVRQVPASWPPQLAARFDADPLARWDSGWYWVVAERGYEWADDGRAHDTAFFPLYPVLMRLTARATGIPSVRAGEVLSIIFTLAAVVLLADLARREGFPPGWTVAAILLFPTAFFLVACYTEGLFLLTTVGALRALRRGRVAEAALWGVAAGLCRPNGILLVVPIIVESLVRRRPRLLVAAAGPMAGTAAVGAYFWARFGSPFLYVRSQNAGWHHHFPWPWRPFIEAWRWLPDRRHDALVAAIVLLLALALLPRFPAYAAWVLASLAFVVATGSLSSEIRYAAVAFPAFFPLAEGLSRSRLLAVLYVAAGLAGLVHLTAQFALGMWVG